MYDLRSFWTVVANELAARCGTESAAADIKYVSSRSGSEGDSFFTITLPAFGKDLEKGLDQGAVTRELFQGWRRLSSTSGPGVIPQFLGGFMSLIFDRNSGVLLLKPDIDAIFAVRQLSLMYSKILLPTSQARTDKAIEGYVECEQEIRRLDVQRPLDLLEEFRQASTVLWGTVLQAVDEDVYYGRIVPRHGPGATADRLKGNRKFDQLEWTERLERVFSWGDFIIPSARYHQEYLPNVNFLEPGAEKPVRVITVPKTLKTPRIIAIEPTCMQYVQQGLLRRFVEYIESPSVGVRNNHNMGFGVVGFSDQAPNQRMAREGSLNGHLATLDLSEASDRVSNQLVRVMLSNFPNLAEGVDACRSRKADVPGHGVIRLAKFASMGSALTFPIEAMVFSTVVFMAIASAVSESDPERSRTSVDTDLILRYRSEVRVFGDDIVAPVRFVSKIVEYLNLFGFKVNSNKSFWTGRFRESCGKEYYHGHDVSIVRVRREFPNSRSSHGNDASGQPGISPGSTRKSPLRSTSYVGCGGEQSRRAIQSNRGMEKPVQSGTWSRKGLISDVPALSIVSTVSLRNLCYMHGLWKAADWLDEQLLGVLSHYPTIAPGSSALGRVSLLGYETQKTSKHTHSPLVKGWSIRAKAPSSKLSGPGALLKCLLGKSEENISEDTLEWLMAISNVDEGHLDRSGRPRVLSIKRGWMQPF